MKGSGIPDRAPTPQALLAKALYDNQPDCFDELAFCRGDILTILEQNVPESKGWWKCMLHGRQGLAPANRLQMLTRAPADRPRPSLPGGLEAAAASSEKAYQVPSLLTSSPPGPIYEHMRSWVEVPLPANDQVYELPVLPANARIICEQTPSSQKQVLLTLPRLTKASSPALSSQVYDVPAQSRSLLAVKELEKQQLYDIPASPQKAALQPPGNQAREHSVPLTSAVLPREGYKTLPNPQKSEWTYGTSVSPEKNSVRSLPLSGLVEETKPSPFPKFVSEYTSPETWTRSLRPQQYKEVSRQKQLSLPEIAASGLPGPRKESVSYKVPSSFLVLHVEQQNTRPNVYDIPKAISSVPGVTKELDKVDGPTGTAAWFSRWGTSVSPETDRLSVSSSESSRASLASSCSSTSTDSSSSSSSEESPKELSMDQNTAKETVTALQHKVAGAVENLMLFVSRKWRFREYLEANIDAVHRAVDHTEESLGEFLDFARGVQETTCNLMDSNLQTRIKEQLQTISCSYQILLETKRSLDSCHWSLEALVTDKIQSSPDDLETFVTVARMVPEDTKRFTFMIIANGKLLFKQNCDKEQIVQLAPNADQEVGKGLLLPHVEMESRQRSTAFNEERSGQHGSELAWKKRTNVCGQNTSSPITQPSSQQNMEKKIRLSEHCRLYFGALFKALRVITSSLSNSQPPETFVTQSKLVIVIGQKLVDTLCKETQERDARNEILSSSNLLCSLLKSLALATKDAALRYPSPAALRHLQAQAEKLEQHTRQFRGALQ
ncbi:PREDICTED: cas scaffolding protein family member 4 [Chrysochloris asiatica]|uniref:Cas scaffolding protein family member 4 n=1 Tax=Chrysochloris asiatica TaxID=185453 RepID=A0A9B0T9D0_CHRAS|nr:PREDICTED: cas scaffolding protein family member 4 [Chrysochloris asiatica]